MTTVSRAAEEPVPVLVSQETLWNLWREFDLNEKIRQGSATFEPQDRYRDREFSQMGVVWLANRWPIAIAHRWRHNVFAPWSDLDPKRMLVDAVSLYCRGS